MVSQIEQEIRKRLNNPTGNFLLDKSSKINLLVKYVGEDDKFDLKKNKEYIVHAVQKYGIEKCYIALYNDSGKFCKYNSDYFEIVSEEDNSENSILNLGKSIFGFKKCNICGETQNTKLIRKIHEQNVCIDCLRDEQINNTHTCSKCGDIDFSKKTKILDDSRLCAKCYEIENKNISNCIICKSDYRPKGTELNIENRGIICGKCSSNGRHKQYEDLFPSNNDRFFKVSSSETSFTEVSYRAFGVEFEVESKEYLRQSARKLSKELQETMIDSKHSLIDYIRAHHDGSLHKEFGVEFVTTILRGDKGLKIIRQLTKILNKYFITSNRCGLHIHLSVEDFDDKELIDLYYIYQNIQPILKYYVRKDRLSNKYCSKIPKLTKQTLSDIRKKLTTKTFDNEEVVNAKKLKDIHTGKHWDGINFSSIPEHGTLELRMMEGTLDYDKIVQWIKLHMRIIDWVKSNNNPELLTTKLDFKEILGEELFEDMLIRKKKYLIDNEYVDDETEE